MACNFKEEYKEFYVPSKKPGIVAVSAMNYIAVRGRVSCCKYRPRTTKGKSAYIVLQSMRLIVK